MNASKLCREVLVSGGSLHPQSLNATNGRPLDLAQGVDTERA